jgi:hypothetical protein
MSTEIPPVVKAGLVATVSHIQHFGSAQDERGTQDLYDILLQFNRMASLRSDFFLCRQLEMYVIAKKIGPLNLPLVSSCEGKSKEKSLASLMAF